jgi:DNA-binding response OmpR family regulator
LAGEAGGPADAAARRILVVDDNDDAGQSLALLLSCRGHEVRVVGDGPAALEEVGRWKPDVVILDIGLPGMDGFEVARCLRRDHGPTGLRLVALTGFGQEEDRRRGAEVGFDEFLVKPAAPEELVRAIHPTAS